MKKIGQLMQEMGFRKDAPEGVQKAFFNHLIKAAGQEPIQIEKVKEQKRVIAEEQLSFSFIEEQPKKPA